MSSEFYMLLSGIIDTIAGVSEPRLLAPAQGAHARAGTNGVLVGTDHEVFVDRILKKKGKIRAVGELRKSLHHHASCN